MATEPPEGSVDADAAAGSVASTGGDATGTVGGSGTGSPAVADARLRRRLDEVFGDVLPSVTVDELGVDEPVRDGRPGEVGPADEELLANRPPHHDRD